MRLILPILLLIAVAESGCVGLAVRAATAAQRPKLDQVLDKADANHDGVITRDEFQAARAMLFTRLDRNGDGYIDKADAGGGPLKRRQAQGRISSLLAMLDKDGDGRVSRQEFVDGPDRLFDRADLNHDGVIDAHELSVFHGKTGGAP